MENSFLYSSAEVLKHFGASESSGLSQNQVTEAKKKYGLNGEFLSILFERISRKEQSQKIGLKTMR